MIKEDGSEVLWEVKGKFVQVPFVILKEISNGIISFYLLEWAKDIRSDGLGRTNPYVMEKVNNSTFGNSPPIGMGNISLTILDIFLGFRDSVCGRSSVRLVKIFVRKYFSPKCSWVVKQSLG